MANRSKNRSFNAPRQHGWRNVRVNDARTSQRLKGASPDVRLRAAEILEKAKQAKEVEAAQNTYMGFVKHMWPAFIEGRHHKIMAEAFERIASGELKRLIVNMPPRHTKSEFASYLLPAWFLGQMPEKRLSRQRTPPSYLWVLAERSETLWIRRTSRRSFPIYS